MNNFMKNLTTPNSKTAYGATALLVVMFSIIMYQSMKNYELEYKLAVCQSDTNNSNNDYAMSRRGKFDYQRVDDNSSRLTY